jgi:hypothetical protein
VAAGGAGESVACGWETPVGVGMSGFGWLVSVGVGGSGVSVSVGVSGVSVQVGVIVSGAAVVGVGVFVVGEGVGVRVRVGRAVGGRRGTHSTWPTRMTVELRQLARMSWETDVPTSRLNWPRVLPGRTV